MDAIIYCTDIQGNTVVLSNEEAYKVFKKIEYENNKEDLIITLKDCYGIDIQNISKKYGARITSILNALLISYDESFVPGVCGEWQIYFQNCLNDTYNIPLVKELENYSKLTKEHIKN